MEKILIIEDNYSLLKIIDRTLTREGYDVTVAHDGNKGIELLNDDSNFKIVITDIRMPGKDGNRVARYIRDNQKMQNTRIIAMAGYADEAQSELFDFLLLKPFNLGELIEAIN
ncbi:response regulator [Thermodesulfobacteriota bacterium]